MTIQDMFAGEEFDRAKESTRHPFVLPGSYPELEVIACKAIKGAADGIERFIVEFEVMRSNVAERPNGSRMSWIVKKNESFMSNIRGFVAIATGQPFETINRDICRAAVMDSQPLKGTRIACVASQVNTRKMVSDGKGGMVPGQYTRCSYSLLKTSPFFTQETTTA